MSARETLQTASLVLNKLHKQFGDRTVLDNLDLTIQNGQFVAVVGRSGCGKSTLLRLIAGLSKPDGGVLDNQHQDNVRVMFQDARLLPWKTVLDNVGLGLKGKWKDKAREALAEVGLADRAGEWPVRLSGGQRQRVALARALVHEPRLLLLDEPLGALDALTRIDMQRLIERLWQRHRCTTLLVTHDVTEAVVLADRIVLIEEGRIGLDLLVDLPRERDRTDPRFVALENKVLSRVLQQPEHPARPEPVETVSISPSQLHWAL